MGEQTDYLIDSMMDRWGSFYDPFYGRTKRAALIKTCNNCGERNLRWQNIKGGAWRLHTVAGDLHVCTPVIERVRGVSNDKSVR